jgi:23S rRNA pseudouridine955/2504/2580 synthase
LFLHAHSLAFTLDGKRISVVAPLPPELEKVLENAGSEL